jgi:hypothetical protein
MTRRARSTYGLGAIPLTGLTLAVGLGLPATAHANITTYLDTLHAAGIHREDSEALEMGSEVCALRELGATPERIQDQAVQNSRSYPGNGMSLDEAARLVAIATVELCDKRHSPTPLAPTGLHSDDPDNRARNVVI